MAVWQQPEQDGDCVAWARGTAQAIEPWSSNGGGYVNYMQADEPIERLRATFGADGFERLRALKRRFDPDNVLRRNQNVAPQHSPLLQALTLADAEEIPRPDPDS